MRARIPRVIAAAATAALSLAGPSAYPMSGAGTSSATSSLDFSISIPRSAELRVTCSLTTVDVTAADIESGFVDVPLAWCVQVRANTPYEISFTARASWFRSALLRGLPAAVEVRDGAGLFEEPRPRAPSVERRLGVTFRLVAGTAPGRYAWPLSIALAGK